MIKHSLSFLLLLAIIGCQKTDSERQAAHLATTSIAVKTAKCEVCVESITKALEKVEGVHKVDVDLKSKVATVQYVPKQTSVGALEKAIADAGYDANSTRRNEEAYRGLAPCCQ